MASIYKCQSSLRAGGDTKWRYQIKVIVKVLPQLEDTGDLFKRIIRENGGGAMERETEIDDYEYDGVQDEAVAEAAQPAELVNETVRPMKCSGRSGKQMSDEGKAECKKGVGCYFHWGR
jgi:hypothetical protein